MKRHVQSDAEVASKAAQLAAWRALSATDQLKALDKRLGAGRGAVKQRKRLHSAGEAK